MVKRTVLIALLTGSLAVVAPASVAASPIVSAPFVTVGVGDTFTIPISIADAVDLTSWQFDLAFDPSIVQFDSLTEGSFMSNFGATLFVGGFQFSGLLSGVADAYVDLPPIPSGNGVLAKIGFTALAAGVSPLTFSNVFLNLSDQGFDIGNGQITVTDTQLPLPPSTVPEPATLVLFISGLGFLARRRLGTRDRSE